MHKKTIGILIGFSLFAPLAMAQEITVPGVTVGKDKIVVEGAGSTIRVSPGGVKVDGDKQPAQTSPSGTQSGEKFVNTEFSNMDLRGRSFAGAKIVNVKFHGSNLENVDFSGASLTNVKFNGANLRGACFLDAKFTNVKFEGANLTDAVFVGAVERNTDYSGAVTQRTIWKGPHSCAQAHGAASRPKVTKAAVIANTLIRGEKIDLTVNFEFDSAQITGSAHKQILEIATALNAPALAGQRIRVEGHTDSDGEDNYNLDLSYRRSVTVVRTLAERYGIESGRLDVKGYGERQPIASNGTDQGKALNRRVTLVKLGSK